MFIDSILTPVSITYCGQEYIKDTPDFLNKLKDMEPQLCAPGVSLFTLDVKALYPSIDPNILPESVEAALDTVTDFSQARKLFIIELVKFSVQNKVVHYRKSWLVSTGASESVCLANIYLKWVLIKFFVKYPIYKS